MRRNAKLAEISTINLGADWPSYQAYSEVADIIQDQIIEVAECR